MMYNKSLEKIPRKIDDMYIYIYKKTERERFAVREYSLAPFLNLLSHKRLFTFSNESVKQFSSRFDCFFRDLNSLPSLPNFNLHRTKRCPRDHRFYHFRYIDQFLRIIHPFVPYPVPRNKKSKQNKKQNKKTKKRREKKRRINGRIMRGATSRSKACLSTYV